MFLFFRKDCFVGRRFRVCNFFTAAGPELASHFGIEPYELDIHWKSLPRVAFPVLIGTKTAPLRMNGVPEYTPHKLRIMINTDVYPYILQSMDPDETDVFTAASLGWGMLIKAFRQFATADRAFEHKDLFTDRLLFNANDLDMIFNSMIADFVKATSTYSGGELRSQLDGTFVGGILAARIVTDNIHKGRTIANMKALAGLIKRLKASNPDPAYISLP